MRKLSFLIVMLLLVTGGTAVWWNNGTGAVDQFDNQTKAFVIEKGQGIREVANELKQEGLIRDPIVFFLLVKKLEADGKIQAGEFHLSPSMTAVQIAKALQVGTFDKRITIPEGKRADEIADILQRNFPSYDESWRDKLNAKEGYLFPDTYSLPEDANIDLIITKMLENFDEKYNSIPDGTKDNLSKEDITKIASLVEREARYQEDRPLVASVILNRLDIGMKLDLDATVQYALGYQEDEKTWWKEHLTITDLKLDSFYNTYLNAGLPPTPISNPGLDVLKAVIEAPDTNYLYYISDSSGHNHYAANYEQHQKNIVKYGL